MSARFGFAPPLMILALAWASAAEPGLDRHYDLCFATVGGEDLQLDLVVPSGGGPHPVVVCLHGGAWKFGSRKELSEPSPWVDAGRDDACLLDVLAGKGFAAASVSYRLAPKAKFPAQVTDVKAAIRYLRANAARLNLDPDRVAVLGFSAGGHLAALVGCTCGRPEFDPELYPDQSDRVCCVVNFFGPTDLSLYSDTPGLERAFLAPLLGGTATALPEAYRKASPVEYVARTAPPFLTIHGTADLVVPVIHGERLHERLSAAGAKSEFLPVKGAGHGWGGKTAAETMTAAVRFLAEHLASGAK